MLDISQLLRSLLSTLKVGKIKFDDVGIKINAKGALFCQYCSKPLDFDTVVKIDEMNKKAMDKLSSLKLEDLQKVLEIAKRLS